MAERWTVEVASDDFERFVRKLPEYEQAVVVAALQHVLAVDGVGICDTEWGKPLGQGLYEFRIRRSLGTILRSAGLLDPAGGRQVLVRVFCSFVGDKVVLLLGGYDKGRDPSDRRQRREIARARAELARWKRESKA